MTILRKLSVFEMAWVERWLSVRQILPTLVRLPWFVRSWRKYEQLSGKPISFLDSYPCILDQSASTPIAGHYFHQAVWATQKISNAKPKFHLDLGSQVQYVAMLAAFQPTIFLDYRPLQFCMDRLMNIGGDILQLPFATDSVPSISCLHVAEHIGLGRYGDPLNPQGTHLAAIEISRVLSPGGDLYFSLPIGQPRTCFNAHRIHSPQQVIEFFPKLDLVTFSAEDDQGLFIQKAQLEYFRNSYYSCGMFHFHKSL